MDQLLICMCIACLEPGNGSDNLPGAKTQHNHKCNSSFSSRNNGRRYRLYSCQLMHEGAARRIPFHSAIGVMPRRQRSALVKWKGVVLV